MQVKISFVIKAESTIKHLKTIHSALFELEHVPRVGETFKFPSLFNEFSKRFPDIIEPVGVVFDSGVDLVDNQGGDPFLLVYIPTDTVRTGDRRIAVARHDVLKHNGWL